MDDGDGDFESAEGEYMSWRILCLALGLSMAKDRNVISSAFDIRRFGFHDKASLAG
jgi:hypothetical protein